MQLTYRNKQKALWPTVIRKYRVNRKLSRAEFALLFGVTRQAVFYWETGQREAPYQVTWCIYKELRDHA